MGPIDRQLIPNADDMYLKILGQAGDRSLGLRSKFPRLLVRVTNGCAACENQNADSYDLGEMVPKTGIEIPFYGNDVYNGDKCLSSEPTWWKAILPKSGAVRD